MQPKVFPIVGRPWQTFPRCNGIHPSFVPTVGEWLPFWERECRARWLVVDGRYYLDAPPPGPRVRRRTPAPRFVTLER